MCNAVVIRQSPTSSKNNRRDDKGNSSISRLLLKICKYATGFVDVIKMITTINSTKANAILLIALQLLPGFSKPLVMMYLS